MNLAGGGGLEGYAGKLQPASDRAGTLWIGDLPYFADETFLHRLFVGKPLSFSKFISRQCL